MAPTTDTKAPKIAVTISLPAEVHAMGKERAKAQARTFSGQIEHLIRQDVEQAAIQSHFAAAAPVEFN